MESVPSQDDDRSRRYCQQHADGPGIQGVQIEDKIPLTAQDKEQMFVDILPQIPADDGVAYLTFYLEEEEDPAEVLEKVRRELEEMRAYVDVEKVRLKNPRPRMWTGSITGNSIFISSILTIFW